LVDLDVKVLSEPGVSGSRSRYPEPVAVRIFNVYFASGEPFLVNRDPELSRNGIDVVHVQVDEGVRSSIALVFGEVETNVSAGNRDEPRESRLELMPPLLVEVQSLIPRYGARGVLDVEDRDDLFVHAPNLSRWAVGVR
jgi:hypothetical protein